MFDGLHSYEIVLMVLGIVMFVLLAAVLVLYVYQRRTPTTLLLFFMFPVVMIGFPAFQKISFANDVVSVEKAAEKLAENPADAKARTQLVETVKQVEQRPTSDPRVNLTLARAYKALGQRDRALDRVNSALPANPHLPEATRLREELRR
jgi:Tetratricopeptide repeat